MPPWLSLLLLPTVAFGQVRIDLPGASPDELAAAERGCEKALGPGRCLVRAAPESSAGATARYHARVDWAPDGPTAQVRFWTHGGPGASGSELRELAFSEQDEVLARFEAIGLVVAAYVMGRSERASQAASRPGSVEPAESVVVPGSTMAPSRPAPRRWAADLLLGAGQAFDRGGARLLVGLRGAVRPFSPPLYLVGQLEGARRFDPIEVDYLSAGLGAALWFPTPWPGLDLQLDLSAVVEHMAVRATHPRTGASASEGRLRLGGRLGGTLLLCPEAGLCILGGVRLNSLSPAVRVELLGASQGTQHVLGIDGILGVRVGG